MPEASARNKKKNLPANFYRPVNSVSYDSLKKLFDENSKIDFIQRNPRHTPPGNHCASWNNDKRKISFAC